MSIANLIEEVIGDLPGPERQAVTSLGQIMDLLAAGEVEAAERRLHRVLRRLQRPSQTYQLPPDLDLDQLLYTPPVPRDWILPGLAPGKVGIIAGPGGIGKSMIVLNVVLAIAGGYPLFGAWTVGSPGDVLYLTGEEDFRDIQERLQAQAQAGRMPITNDARQRIHLKAVGGAPPKFLGRRPDGSVQPHADAIASLEATLDAYAHPRLLILDPLMMYHTLEENSNADMGQFLELCTHWAQSYHMAVLLVHHVAKGADGGRQQDAVRGASSLVNEARWLATVAPISDTAAAALHVSDTDRWRYITVQVPKINQAAAPNALLLQKGIGGSLSLVGLPASQPQAATKSIKIRKEDQDNDDKAWYG